MNKFTPYQTLVHNTGQPIGIEFDGTNEALMKLQCIQEYLAYPDVHLTISCDCLYGIKDNGFKWELLGLIKDPSLMDLPIFPGWKIKAYNSIGMLVVFLGPEIEKIIGNDIWLKDGTRAVKYGAVA